MTLMGDNPELYSRPGQRKAEQAPRYVPFARIRIVRVALNRPRVSPTMRRRQASSVSPRSPASTLKTPHTNLSLLQSCLAEDHWWKAAKHSGE